MPVKYTQEQVKNIFANVGCKLLSTYYTSSEPVQYCCSCGEIAFISVSHFLMGQRCRTCRNVKIGNTKRISHEFVVQYFKDQGCILISIYLNCDIPIQYQCSCGNIAYITFHDFQRGHRCTLCGHIKTGHAQVGNKNHQWNLDREQVQQNKEIREQQSRLLWGCLIRLGTKKEGHTHEILGYSAVDLDSHLRAFSMYAYLQDTHTLAIDHILPVKAFIDHGIIDPKIICALDNLQPLSRSENCEKNDWYLEEDFLLYCQKHNIALLAEAI
jgi:hypothetical protein